MKRSVLPILLTLAGAAVALIAASRKIGGTGVWISVSVAIAATGGIAAIVEAYFDIQRRRRDEHRSHNGKNTNGT